MQESRRQERRAGLRKLSCAPRASADWDWSWRESAAQDAKNDLEKSAALYNVGQAKLDAAQRISEELNRKVVFDGTLPVDKTGVIDRRQGPSG